MFTIEMLPAGHGDSLLLVYGDAEKPHYILIDGGPYNVYTHKKDTKRVTLKKRTQQILDKNGQLELLVITHIDSDHIEAPLRLLANKPRDLKIGEVLFNNRNHLEQRPTDGGGVLGAAQGEMLSALIQEKLRLSWNSSFDNRAVQWDPISSPPTITLPDGLQFTVLSPTPEKLENLIPEWDDVIEQTGLDIADEQERQKKALELLRKNRRVGPEPEGFVLGGDPVRDFASEPFEEDSTPPNGSSIALLVEFEGKSCLFAGDAHPSVLVDSISRLLLERGGDQLQVDAFKLPHHGSKNNLSPELVKLVKTNNYLFSSNGSYFQHPHPQTIARILEENQSEWDKVTLWFNYRTKQTLRWEEGSLQASYNYQVRYPSQNHQPVIVEL